LTVLELKREKRRRGDVALMGERKGATWWFGSASSKHERVAIGGVWRGGAAGRAAAAALMNGGRQFPSVGWLGSKWATLAGLRLGRHRKKMSWAAKAIGPNWWTE
jgi:hypothetical protein